MSMPLIIVHGNGLTAIERKVLSLKKRFDALSIQEFNSRDASLDQALLLCANQDLFAQKRLVVLEGFDDTVDLNLLPEDPQLTIVLKFNKNLSAISPILKSAVAKKAEIIGLSEAEEKAIFPFLDLLAQKNQRAAAQLDTLLEQYGGQYLLTMVFYLLRRMVQPTEKLPRFVAQKIATQKQNFNLQKISSLYEVALETDFKIKTGQVDEEMGLTLLVDKILTV